MLTQARAEKWGALGLATPSSQRCAGGVALSSLPPARLDADGRSADGARAQPGCVLTASHSPRTSSQLCWTCCPLASAYAGAGLQGAGRWVGDRAQVCEFGAKIKITSITICTY